MDELLEKYRSQGVFLDSNLLLLLVVGLWREDHIDKHKRLSKYKREDFRLLRSFVARFRVIVTTPNALTEVSNLSFASDRRSKSELFVLFRTLIKSFSEQYQPSAELVELPAFIRHGLADAAILAASQGKYLVLTDDLPLYAHLLEQGVGTVNFNHLRSARMLREE